MPEIFQFFVFAAVASEIGRCQTFAASDVAHHLAVREAERNREHSIRDQRAALNVGFMERLQCFC